MREHSYILYMVAVWAVGMLLGSAMGAMAADPLHFHETVVKLEPVETIVYVQNDTLLHQCYADKHTLKNEIIQWEIKLDQWQTSNFPLYLQDRYGDYDHKTGILRVMTEDNNEYNAALSTFNHEFGHRVCIIEQDNWTEACADEYMEAKR